MIFKNIKIALLLTVLCTGQLFSADWKTYFYWSSCALPLVGLVNSAYSINFIRTNTEKFSDTIDPKIKAIIHDVLQKMNIPIESVKIRKWRFDFSPEGRSIPLFATGRVMVINEQLCKTISEEELRGVAAHEAMHIVHNDGIYAGILQSSLHLSLLAGAHLIQKICSQKLSDIHSSVSIPVASSVVTTLLVKAYSRFFEKRADYEAAHRSHETRGLIAYFKRWKTIHGASETSYLMTSHPSTDDRIAYLTKIADEQDTQFTK